MLSKLAWNASRIVARKGGRVADSLYGLAFIYASSYKNLNYDMETNGERRLLDMLGKSNPQTVFDVGANKGDYTAACLQHFPQANIHAFEIVPATFCKLQAAVGQSERVVLNERGLSNEAGELEINYNPDHDGSSSLVEGGAIHKADWQRVKVNVCRGDEYCRQAGITSIDLLKIDVEGAEHLVLDGFKAMFDRGGISAVQFEFGLVNIYSKFLLNDFWSFFHDAGFRLGPIMPDGVAFREYDPRHEDFQGPPNFLAVHRSRADMMDLVGRKTRV